MQNYPDKKIKTVLEKKHKKNTILLYFISLNFDSIWQHFSLFHIMKGHPVEKEINKMSQNSKIQAHNLAMHAGCCLRSSQSFSNSFQKQNNDHNEDQESWSRSSNSLLLFYF